MCSSTPALHKARMLPRSWWPARLNSVRVFISHGIRNYHLACQVTGKPCLEKSSARFPLCALDQHQARVSPARLQAHPVRRNMPELPPTLLCRGPDHAPRSNVSQWLRASHGKFTRSGRQIMPPATNNGSGVGEQKTVARLTSSATLLAPETDVPCPWEAADVACNGR